MNQTPLSVRSKIIELLCEGCSLRSTVRLTNTSFNTCVKLLIDVGKACQRFHDEKVIHLKSKRIQVDEIWSFIYAKEKNVPDEMKGKGAGDCWTWTGLCADTKLIVSWYIGDRSAESANILMQDIAHRVSNRIQLTSDGYKPYLQAVENAFGNDIDYSTLNKLYGSVMVEGQSRYSPAQCNGTTRKRISGNPDPKHVSTSYVERHNLTMRMQMRRFTRLTNAFSKKLENHCYSVALFFVFYNFCRIHKTLRVTPAMESGLTTEIMSIEDIILLTELKNDE